MFRKSDKRKRLIDIAKNLIYQQGFNVTTLSDIANEADVPLGNVYYYFKTKADIGAAILNAIAAEQQIFLKHLNTKPLPQMRLHYFLEQAKQDDQLVILQGCRVGTLCHEFAKEGGVLHKLAANIMMDAFFWIEAQFYKLGLTDEASDLSLHLMYGLQGAFLLAYAFKDSNLITRQITLLQNFVKEQSAKKVNEFEEIVQSECLEMS